ncbi:MAG TPA: hypothetical protein VFZ83_02690 [Acidimicrobiia bacterium]|nr:hypothetical protein [Acidimicrobiia bacterium]
MAIVVLLILAVLWAVVLVPPLLRSRTQQSGDSIDDFNYRLGVLGRTNGTFDPSAAPARVSPLPPVRTDRPSARPLTPAAKRRRDVMTILAAAVAATFILASVGGAPILWAVQVIADLLLVAYLALYAWFRSLSADRERTVHALSHRAPSELALRRIASS